MLLPLRVIEIYILKNNIIFMPRYKKILFLIFFLFQNPSIADNIEVYNFNFLINSNPKSGDTIILENNLDSNQTIGNNFLNLNIDFIGNDYYIDGKSTFGGFILNKDSSFKTMVMRNCLGQEYSSSYFAGAIFNSGGNITIDTSVFNNNFVDAKGFNFGVGGAIYNLNGADMKINSVLFQNNYTKGASSYGGAVANGYREGQKADMTISDSVFYNNYSTGSVTPYGGAIYNEGNLDINNTLIYDNYVSGESGSFAYGGAIYNNDNIKISNSLIENNYILAPDAFAFGGAVFNNGNLEIENSILNSNSTSSNSYSVGGAIYNNMGKILTIINSTLENNRTSNAIESSGGAVYNSGVLNIENSTFKNNFEKDNIKNDIFNAQNAVINFNGKASAILSGIKGYGEINNFSTLNLGGENLDFKGDFYFREGIVNLLPDSTYFGATDNYFSNNVSLNLQNSTIDNVSFNNLNIEGLVNIYPDVNLNLNLMDTISADSINGFGEILVKNLKIEGAPHEKYREIPFSNSILKDYIKYDETKISTPIFEYSASYNSNNGNFIFERKNFNPSILSSSIAAQTGGYLTQIDTFKNVFSNLDMVRINPQNGLSAFGFDNKTNSDRFLNINYYKIPEIHKGLWFKPYSLFEEVPLKNGFDVSNIGYGTILGYETGLKNIKDDIYALFGGYISYNGSNQSYFGNDIYNNGGMFGLIGAFYKKDFFSLLAIDSGAFSSNAKGYQMKEEFTTFNAGISQKTGFNFKTFNNRLIIQPSIMTSYAFINTFDYDTSYLNFKTKPLNAIHVEPMIKLIGNFENNFQPYIFASFAWNILDKTKFRANDINLPYLSVKPYVQYGIGFQKRFSEKLTAFFETAIRNCGRQGAYLQLGLRFSI